jgi:hypothetical protein
VECEGCVRVGVWFLELKIICLSTYFQLPHCAMCMSKTKVIRAYSCLWRKSFIVTLQLSMRILMMDFYSFHTLSVCVQAPKRNQSALMLSGIGRNAIGFDLDPKVRSPHFVITTLGTHICILYLPNIWDFCLTGEWSGRKNARTLGIKNWIYCTFGFFFEFVSTVVSCSNYRNWYVEIHWGSDSFRHAKRCER